MTPIVSLAEDCAQRPGFFKVAAYEKGDYLPGRMSWVARKVRWNPGEVIDWIVAVSRCGDTHRFCSQTKAMIAVRQQNGARKSKREGDRT